MPIPQVGAIDLAIIVTFKDQEQNVIDLSVPGTATGIHFRRPNGRVTIHIASFVTDGTDGQVIYRTVAGDIDTPGEWQIQGHVVNLDQSFDFYTDVQPFRVGDNLATL